MKTKKNDEDLRQLAIRLPPALVSRLEKHAERLRRQSPGLTITRVDAIRALLIEALDAVEAREPAA